MLGYLLFKKNGQGISLGNYLNIGIPGAIEGDFTFVTQTPLYMHEYGHYIDGQRMAGVYFQGIGIPSVMNNVDFFNKLFGIGDSDSYYTEKRANRRASDYFDEHYHVDWSQYDNDVWQYYR